MLPWRLWRGLTLCHEPRLARLALFAVLWLVALYVALILVVRVAVIARNEEVLIRPYDDLPVLWPARFTIEAGHSSLTTGYGFEILDSVQLVGVAFILSACGIFAARYLVSTFQHPLAHLWRCTLLCVPFGLALFPLHLLSAWGILKLRALGDAGVIGGTETTWFTVLHVSAIAWPVAAFAAWWHAAIGRYFGFHRPDAFAVALGVLVLVGLVAGSIAMGSA